MIDDPVPLLKEQLRREILRNVENWPQCFSAPALGLDQPRMSDLERSKLDRFSLEKLIRILALIDQRVEFSVKNQRGRRLGMFDAFRDRS